MEPEEIQERIAEIRTEINEKIVELDELIAQLGGDDRGSGRRRKFTIIRGGLGAAALPAALLARRPRHPLGIAAAAAVTGAVALILAVPAHTTPGGPGNAISYMSLPAIPPPSDSGGTAAASRGASSSPSSISSSGGAQAGAARRPYIRSPVPSVPGASGALPSSTVSPAPAPTSVASSPGPLPTTPMPQPTGTITPPPVAPSTCLINVDVEPILQVCVDL